MSVEGNAYSNLLKLMSVQGYSKDVNVTIGTILSLKPLTIQLDGFQIKEGDFSIVESLTEYKRDILLEVKNTTGSTEYILTVKSPLKKGDKVLVLIDESSFYIIDKVV